MTEQELNKACDWLEKYMESLGYIDEWCRNGENTFRKAMDAVIKDSLTTEWHKVTEELPPYDKVVIVAYDGYTEDCCFNHRSNDPEVKTSENGWCDVGYDTEPTHWMPIPEIKED